MVKVFKPNWSIGEAPGSQAPVPEPRVREPRATCASVPQPIDFEAFADSLPSAAARDEFAGLWSSLDRLMGQGAGFGLRRELEDYILAAGQDETGGRRQLQDNLGEVLQRCSAR